MYVVDSAKDNYKISFGIIKEIAIDDAQLLKTTEGEINARKEDTRDSGKRNGSVDSRKSVRIVEESTRRNTKRQQAQRSRAQKIRDAISTLQARGQDAGEISSKSLGLKNGTDEKSLTIVPKSIYTDELDLIKGDAESSGYKVVFFAGEIKLKDGSTARGAISGNTIYIRADHNNLSAEQIYLHEKFHGMIAKDSGLMQSAADAIVSEYSQSELDGLVGYYIEAYDGANLSYTEALEEILCDAYADINIFEGTNLAAELGGYGASKYAGKVRVTAFESNQSSQADSGGVRFSRNLSRKNNYGENINEYYNALSKEEWYYFYKQIADKGYLKLTNVGDIITILVGDKLLLAERKMTGKDAHDFQVYDAFKVANRDDAYSLYDILEDINQNGGDYNERTINRSAYKLSYWNGQNTFVKRYDKRSGIYSDDNGSAKSVDVFQRASTNSEYEPDRKRISKSNEQQIKNNGIWTQNLKRSQFDIIQATNPMWDEYHLGIRIYSSRSDSWFER